MQNLTLQVRQRQHNDVVHDTRPKAWKQSQEVAALNAPDVGGCRISPDQENRKENKENLNPESADEKPTRSYAPQTRPLVKNNNRLRTWDGVRFKPLAC
jgi:hypothetical protein